MLPPLFPGVLQVVATLIIVTAVGLTLALSYVVGERIVRRRKTLDGE